MKIYFGNEQEEYEREQRKEKIKGRILMCSIIGLYVIMCIFINMIFEKIVHILENGGTTLSFCNITIQLNITYTELPYLLTNPKGISITCVIIFICLLIIGVIISKIINFIKKQFE